MEAERYHFAQTDLLVRYMCGEKEKKRYDKHEDEFCILYFKKGRTEIKYKNKIYFTNSDDVIIANSKEKFVVNYDANNAEYYEIRFKSKFFNEVDKKIDLMKPFNFSKDIKLYTKEHLNIYFFNAFDNLYRALCSQSSRAYVISGVLQIICELNYIYEKLYPPLLKETDSNFTKLYRYIDDHLFEKLTLQSVSDNVFISKRGITYIVRRISKCSFHQLLTRRRLDKANFYLEGDNYNLNEISAICGFDTYSSFYRAYKKEYGISPKQYRINLKKIY